MKIEKRWFLACCLLICGITHLTFGEPVADPAKSSGIDYSYGDYDEGDTGSTLALDKEMEDKSAMSAESAQFKCRVSATGNRNVTFEWYKGSDRLQSSDGSDRISIKTKSYGSSLKFSQLYSSDSGTYTCEATNGVQRVSTSAKLTVTFPAPPPSVDGGSDNADLYIGKCEMYKGSACSQYIGNNKVFVDAFQNQDEMEDQITAALSLVGKPDLVSDRCRDFARPAFCHFVYPICDDGSSSAYEDEYSDVSNDKPIPKPIKFCREDCEVLKHDICADEFSNDNEYIQALVRSADCSILPKTESVGTHCTKLTGIERALDLQHNCYNETGVKYRGATSTSRSGSRCKTWPDRLLAEYPELAGGHNFCRNPGNELNRPWCFIDRERIVKEECDVVKCESTKGTPWLMILVPCAAIPLLIGCIVGIMCFCRQRKTRTNKNGFEPGRKVKMSQLSDTTPVVNLPDLPPSLVQFTMDLGDGKFGKVYKAQILSNMQYSPSEPVAVKTLNESLLQTQIDDFYREMEVFSHLQHPNVSCLKAIVTQSSMRCMIFEYTNRIDLHEMLNLHSPHSDIGVKIGSSASSQASYTLEPGDFIHMAVQIASGMEYLSNHNFIHRDLSARNILVCNNMQMKICNLGVVRDCYISCYYRSPQGGSMLPIRWMSPEAISSNQFSEKSAMWSYGVMLWEMFSYGLQPYCGYNNHEVIDMIQAGKLLSCPDQCSARVYAFMTECWNRDFNLRPTFKDAHAKLSGWEGSSTTRMTSQLAQGIHRQLHSVVRVDGQVAQYSPVNQSMDGSCSTGHASQNNFVGNPQQAAAPPYMATSPPHPAPPHASPASQQYSSSSNTASSRLNNPQLPHAGYGQQQYPPPYGPQHPSHPAYPHKYGMHQSRPYSSSRSSGSCSSSARNFIPPYIPEQTAIHQTSHDPRNSRYSHSQEMRPVEIRDIETSPHNVPTSEHDASHTSIGQRSRVASGHSESAASHDEAFTSSPTRSVHDRPTVAPKPPIKSNNLEQLQNNIRNRNHNNHIANLPKPPPMSPQSRQNSEVRTKLPSTDSEQQSDFSRKRSTSFDSGLPGEETEMPQENSSNSYGDNYPRGSTLKTPLIVLPSSASSSVSGSTAVTAESRLTS